MRRVLSAVTGLESWTVLGDDDGDDGPIQPTEGGLKPIGGWSNAIPPIFRPRESAPAKAGHARIGLAPWRHDLFRLR